jgi:hypothetical protein
MHSQVETHKIHRTGQKQRFLFGFVFIIFFNCATLPAKSQNAQIVYGALVRF